MATKPVKSDAQENRLSDSDYETWETVSSEFGTKLMWGDGTGGTTTVFVGEYLGENIVPMGEVDDDGNALDTAPAAEFVDSNGEKFYCWQNYAIKTAIEEKKFVAGDTVRIKYLGSEQTKRGLNPVTKLQIQVKPRS